MIKLIKKASPPPPRIWTLCDVTNSQASADLRAGLTSTSLRLYLLSCEKNVSRVGRVHTGMFEGRLAEDLKSNY